MNFMANSETIRGELVEALKLDLVGPSNDHAFARELLTDAPSRWYLTGFLVPSDAPVEQRTGQTSDVELDSAGEGDAGDDDAPPDRGAARRKFLPSSMGLSVLIDSEVRELEVTVCWGDYGFEGGGEEPHANDEQEGDIPTESATPADEGESTDKKSGGEKRRRGYRRTPKESKVQVQVPESGTQLEVPVPSSDGLVLFLTVRG